MINEVEERKFLIDVLFDFSDELSEFVHSSLRSELKSVNTSHKRACLYIEISRVVMFEQENDVKNVISNLISEYQK